MLLVFSKLLNFNQIGATTGIALAIILFFGFGYFLYLFTTDSNVLDIARSGVLVRLILHAFYHVLYETGICITILKNKSICSLSLYHSQLMPLLL